MARSLLARRLPVVSIAACIALLGSLTAAGPSRAAQSGAARQGQPVRLTASMSRPLPSGAVRLGQLAAGTRLSLEVTLSVPDQTALTAFLGGLTNSRSPYYQRFLRPGQFGPRFGPSFARVAAVVSALRAAGLSPGHVSANRLAIPVTATASAIEHAFGITLDSYRLPGGRTVYANTSAPVVPAAVAPLIQGVLGLSDVFPEQPLGIRSRGTAPIAALTSGAAVGAAHPTGAAAAAAAAAAALGPKPCAAATGSIASTANIFAAIYGMNLLYQVGDLGSGIKIGVAELEPNLHSDIAADKRCYGISTKVSYTKVDGGARNGPGTGEAALDIETIAGLAPKASIGVYQAPNTQTGFYDIFKKFATSDVDRVLSVSWGSCEAETALFAMQAEETVFEQANAQGQVIFSAAGDEGSTSCYDPSAATADDSLSTLSPASAPYVLGVGGTSFANGKPLDQVVWNDSGEGGLGAGGGGVSSVWCMPGYQHQPKIPGVMNAHSVANTSASCKTKHQREVPDISASGDPNYGYAVYFDGSWVMLGIGGTSAATPLWASVAGLIDASPWCKAYGSRAPMLPQNIYKAVAADHSYIYGKSPQVVRDVTRGNNDYTDSGYSGGLYPATKGYDMASGLGAPMVSGLFHRRWYEFIAGLTQVLCHQTATKLTSVRITRLSPNSGRAHKKTRITVIGKGFLPIGYGADQAWIMSGSRVLAKVTAFCTTTKCHVTLPAESPRKVEIRIYAGSLWPSRQSRADHYRYKR